MIEISEYLREDGSSPFADWFNSLNSQAAAKVTTYLLRLEQGNTSSLKSVGSGVHECRIDWGPGYRVYLGWDGKKLVILLGGGNKRILRTQKVLGKITRNVKRKHRWQLHAISEKR